MIFVIVIFLILLESITATVIGAISESHSDAECGLHYYHIDPQSCSCLAMACTTQADGEGKTVVSNITTE